MVQTPSPTSSDGYKLFSTDELSAMSGPTSADTGKSDSGGVVIPPKVMEVFLLRGFPPTVPPKSNFFTSLELYLKRLVAVALLANLRSGV